MFSEILLRSDELHFEHLRPPSTDYRLTIRSVSTGKSLFHLYVSRCPNKVQKGLRILFRFDPVIFEHTNNEWLLFKRGVLENHGKYGITMSYNA